MRLDAELLEKSAFLGQSMNKIRECEDAGTLLGLENLHQYIFRTMEELIHGEKKILFYGKIKTVR